MTRDVLGVLERAAIVQIGRDAGTRLLFFAELHANTRCHRAPANHPVGVRLTHRPSSRTYLSEAFFMHGRGFESFRNDTPLIAFAQCGSFDQCEKVESWRPSKTSRANIVGQILPQHRMCRQLATLASFFQ